MIPEPSGASALSATRNVELLAATSGTAMRQWTSPYAASPKALSTNDAIDVVQPFHELSSWSVGMPHKAVVQHFV